MSRLLGFVRSGVPPEDSANYWIWQATDFPPDPRWDYERLQVQTFPAADGNILVRILGPHTPRVQDGVFLHMHMNAEHQPQPKLSDEAEPALMISWNERLAQMNLIAPRAGLE